MLKTFALLTASLFIPTAAAAQLTQPDRDALMKDLERSRTVFLEAIADVKTEAQWNYKPAPDRWSVAECAAHIIAAEEYFRENVAAALKSPAMTPPVNQAERDAMIAKMIRDRSQRFQAPAQIEPTGKAVPKAQAIADFNATRNQTLDYVRTTNHALRDHSTGTPPNQMTAYQLILMLSGHTERHTAQLLEVKASPGYPKQ
jgi:hypothetical protein